MANFLEKTVDSMHLLEQIQLYPLGEAALVLQAGLAQQRRLQVTQALVLDWPEVLAAILGVGNLTLRFDPLLTDGQVLASELKKLFLNCDLGLAQSGRLIELPIRYGGELGPDLALVARLCDLSITEVILRHSAVTYEVLCVGFLPGFPYLAGLPAELACPRRASPRLSVAAGSVGIGGAQTGVYPSASPGGWQLIGHCPELLFDAKKSPPSLLQAGDRVRFIPMDALQ